MFANEEMLHMMRRLVYRSMTPVEISVEASKDAVGKLKWSDDGLVVPSKLVRHRELMALLQENMNEPMHKARIFPHIIIRRVFGPENTAYFTIATPYYSYMSDWIRYNQDSSYTSFRCDHHLPTNKTDIMLDTWSTLYSRGQDLELLKKICHRRSKVYVEGRAESIVDTLETEMRDEAIGVGVRDWSFGGTHAEARTAMENKVSIDYPVMSDFGARVRRLANVHKCWGFYYLSIDDLYSATS